MRTSRIAKETAKLFSALSPSKRTGGRRTRNNSNNAAIITAEDTEQTSSPTTSPQIKSEPATPALKRKRDASPSPSARKVIKQEEAVIHRKSPRKTSLATNGKSAIPRKARRQPAKTIRGTDGNVTVEAPPNWEEMYAVTQGMRKMVLAPVDTMGCESLAEDHRTPKEKRFQTLISLMLSSQTKDTVTAVAMQRLQQHLAGGLTLESILKASAEDIDECINKVGFHNTKAKNIKITAEMLRDQWDGDIPDTIEGMMSLRGVGPKMSYLLMSAAWGRHEGIGVDVHVHRITNLWGWHKTNTPEETRAILESWLPKDKWHDINHLLVGFGQTWCPPVGRKCDACHLGQKGLCPSAVVSKPTKARVKKDEAAIEVDGLKTEVKRSVDVKIEDREIQAEDLSANESRPIVAEPSDIEDLGRRPRRSLRATVG